MIESVFCSHITFAVNVIFAGPRRAQQNASVGMSPSARRAPPRYQLVAGDRHNFALGVLAAFGLAALKNLSEEKLERLGAPPFFKWNLNAYTTWNLAFLGLRILLQQQQWDPFLLVNSVGIFLGFRTAFAQGLDENMRKKIKGLGFELSRFEFVAADHLLHTLPPAVLLASLVRRRQRCHPMNSVHCLVLFSWFAFRQTAQIDIQSVYMPHPFYRGLLAIVVGAFASPPLVDALIDRSKGRVLLCALAMLVPYLTTKLDPDLWKKYNFAAAVARAQLLQAQQQAARTAKRKGASGLTRVNSETPMALRREGISP